MKRLRRDLLLAAEYLCRAILRALDKIAAEGRDEI